MFWETPRSSIVSPCVFEESFGGGLFLFWFYSVQQVFENWGPAFSKLIQLLALSEFISVSFLNTCRHFFIQPLVCKPFFWETDQCANSTVCLPQCVRDFLTVFVMFSSWICQTWRAASSTASFLQREAAGTPRIHQADFSCLSVLGNVGKTVVVTSMFLPSPVNTNRARLIEECVLPVWDLMLLQDAVPKCYCAFVNGSFSVCAWGQGTLCSKEWWQKSLQCLSEQSWRYQGSKHLRPERLPENCSLKRALCFVTPEGFSTSSCKVGIYRLFVSIMLKGSRLYLQYLKSWILLSLSFHLPGKLLFLSF